MQSETKAFSHFVEFLKSSGVLSADEVDEALAFLDGVCGVVSEGTYTLGYEGLARCIGKKLAFDEQRAFVERHFEEMGEDADARYFFAQSLIDNPTLQQNERIELIGLMPSNYQPFLLKRFSL
ncbi:hypothetical protein RA27_22460 [Ruegeria sp. ANG-R]|uniref:hypothetical protein n=1 Tax=Ruegeria sp. ANG-R TaxID=1577903 RepID=UPI00057C3D1A|nr:hypothetical protein [Ruegeria sp. ANG-R]KIC36104.1 hypothetical protein RA27_22460 [Ruegeria sp. ANG-R]